MIYLSDDLHVRWPLGPEGGNTSKAETRAAKTQLNPVMIIDYGITSAHIFVARSDKHPPNPSHPDGSICSYLFSGFPREDYLNFTRHPDIDYKKENNVAGHPGWQARG